MRHKQTFHAGHHAALSGVRCGRAVNHGCRLQTRAAPAEARAETKGTTIPRRNVVACTFGFALRCGNAARFYAARWRALPVFLGAALALVLVAASPARGDAAPVRFGLTPAIVHDQYGLMDDLRRYLERRLKRPVEMVSRDSYRDAMDLLEKRKLDFAWVSDYPFVYLEHYRHARLLLTPLYRHAPYYRAYLIVPNDDTTTRSLLDLRGKVFAYADPYSNSGYLVPRFELHRAGFAAPTFFRKTFFTLAHRRVVESVAAGLADGGYVDGFVWDTLALIEPGLTAKTRIVTRSPEFGFPPIVAQYQLDGALAAQVQQVFLGMAHDPDGAALLKRLNLDGFIAGRPELYATVARMMRTMGELR
jgi:phosphonate transport system substrate-binding protein